MNACLANCAKAQHDLARSQASHPTEDPMQRISMLACHAGHDRFAGRTRLLICGGERNPAVRYQKSLCQPDRKC